MDEPKIRDDLTRGNIVVGRVLSRVGHIAAAFSVAATAYAFYKSDDPFSYLMSTALAAASGGVVYASRRHDRTQARIEEKYKNKF